MTVAILGAGISGLVAGRTLRERGVDVEILEASDQPGGLCRSDVVDGYVVDRAGGHIVFSKHPEAMDYYHALFEDEPLVQSERHTRILYQGRYIPYPFENGIGHLPAEDRLACLKGVLESSVARAMGAPKPDNFGDWIHWQMGSGIARLFMEPYNRKIWELADLREMGISWVDGRVPEAPVADVIRSALGETTVGYAHQAVFWYPQRGGFQAITDRLARRLSDCLRLDTPVTDVRAEAGAVVVNGKRYDAAVSTLPLPVLAGLTQGIDATTREAAGGLGHISLACFLFGISGEDVPPLSWVYLPHPEQGPANRVTYLSNYSPGNAPAGRGSLMAEVTYRGAYPVSTDSIRQLRRQLAAQGLFREEQVDVEVHRDTQRAYLHQGRDFVPRRRQAIDGFERVGIVPLGRFGRYNYHNTDLCILEAIQRALALASRLSDA